MPKVVSKLKSRSDAIEEEARKLREDNETALVLQQFIETFDETRPTNKVWVKGGTVNPGSSGHEYSGSGGIYQPSQKKTDIMEKIKGKLIPDPLEKPIISKSRKKTNQEAFAEELRQLQEMRALRPRGTDGKRTDDTHKISHQSQSLLPPISSYDLDFPYDAENDKTTTNLFLGNLSPELSEQHLCELFGRYGPLASVKVMWPRNDEEKSRGRNCGFVAFMNRSDGERALEKLRGAEICSFEMKLGWGKTVLIPPYPIYVPPLLLDRIKPPPPSGLPFNAQPREWLEKYERGLTFDRKYFDMFSMTDEELYQVLSDCVVKVCVPTDRALLQLINRSVEFVTREGVEFEAYIMNKEMRNPAFKFLFDFQCPEHTYYRWRLYSILHGDSTKNWRTEEFKMFKAGPVWKPPPINPFTSGMPDELLDDWDVNNITVDTINRAMIRREEREYAVHAQPLPETTNAPTKNVFNDEKADKLMEILDDLDPGKFSVGEAMVWCMEQADHAEEVLGLIVKSIEKIIEPSVEKYDDTDDDIVMDRVRSEQPNSTKQDINHAVALLYLVSDLLHNSSAKVKNASYYRKHIEIILPNIMRLYNKYYTSFTSKVKSELLKTKVLTCFKAWGDWYVYPFDYLLKLQTQFLGIPEVIKNEQQTDAESGDMNGNNLMDGKPLVDYDGDPQDIDGTPLELGVSNGNLDVEQPKNDLFDMFTGTTLSPESSKHQSGGDPSGSMFVPSKWETVDPAEDEADVVQSRWQLMEDAAAAASAVKSDNEDGYPLSEDGFDLGGKSALDQMDTKLVSYGGDSEEEEEEEEIPLPETPPSRERNLKRDRKKDKNNSEKITSSPRLKRRKRDNSDNETDSKSRDRGSDRDKKSDRHNKESSKRSSKKKSRSRDKSISKKSRSRSRSSRNSHKRKSSRR